MLHISRLSNILTVQGLVTALVDILTPMFAWQLKDHTEACPHPGQSHILVQDTKLGKIRLVFCIVSFTKLLEGLLLLTSHIV